MSFTVKHQVISQYLRSGTKRRSGQLLQSAVKFIVAHDTGNPNSTAAANVAYYNNTLDTVYQSAHIFVDDTEILECIPALTAPAEKAWHVRYDIPEDNRRYGANANDVAIGVEYCYGPNINADEAYKRYVWTLAYLCFRFQLPSKGFIVAHSTLDPGRRSDPDNGLGKSGRSFIQLVEDVDIEYRKCTQSTVLEKLKLVKFASSNKIFAVAKDGKKHWIKDEMTFNHGREMGLWGDWPEVEMTNDNYAEGYTIHIG